MAWTTLARFVKSGVVERVAHGVYRLRGTPPDDQIDIHAAWLQLAPDTKVWERIPAQGVVSHRSAAAIYGFGHLPADIHQFILPMRRQTRRDDVRLYKASVGADEWVNHQGLIVTRPARVVADLLDDREDPEAVARVVIEAVQSARDDPGAIALAVASQAGSFGFEPGNGLAVLDWLLELAGDPRRDNFIDQARRMLRRGSR